MVLTNTPICNFDDTLKNFLLLDVDNKTKKCFDFIGEKGTLIMFICNHCPYVKAVIDLLVNTALELKKYGVNSIAIMPNDIVKYPEDNFENMKEFSKKNFFNFPYFLDESQSVAKEYGAVCTPDFFGYNSEGKLNYRGRITALNKLKIITEKNDLLDAMIKISNTGKGPKEQFPSMGCSIKWK